MNSPNRHIVLAVPKDRAVFLALVSVVFIAAGIAYTVTLVVTGTLDANLSMLALAIIACLAILLFVVGATSLLITVFSSRATLIFDSHGVHNDTPLFGAGLIKWEEVAGLASYCILTQPYLAIVLRDPRTILARTRLLPRLTMLINAKISPAPVNIPDSLLPVSADQALRAVRSEFSQELQRHGIWVRSSSETRA